MTRNRLKTVFVSILIEVLVIACVTFANLYPKPLFYFFFYHILYGMMFSFLVPLFLLQKEENVFDFIGLKPLGRKQITVLSVFIFFSVGGQIGPVLVSGGIIPWRLLPVGVAPLIVTTFFEEFLFRGFFQNKFESFGALPAVFISGLLFSLYHIGYPGFRTWGDLLLLFAVGVGFAMAYHFSGSNLIVVYFVNLPNAFVTYMLKHEQFPVMGMSSVIASIVVLFFIIAIFALLVDRRFDESQKVGYDSRQNM